MKDPASYLINSFLFTASEFPAPDPGRSPKTHRSQPKDDFQDP